MNIAKWLPLWYPEVIQKKFPGKGWTELIIIIIIIIINWYEHVPNSIATNQGGKVTVESTSANG